jgi:hypothetical protein
VKASSAYLTNNTSGVVKSTKKTLLGKNRGASEPPKVNITETRNNSVAKINTIELTTSQAAEMKKTNNAKLDKLRVKFTRKHNN